MIKDGRQSAFHPYDRLPVVSTVANGQWMVDFKGHFRLGDRSMCHPLAVQDDATRYVLCMDGHGSTSTGPVVRSFERIFRKRGLPERIHSDNGVPSAGSGVGRLSRVMAKPEADDLLADAEE